MIHAQANDRTRFVTQADHAHLAAEILSLWVLDGLPTHPRRDELLLAVREHDNGWRESDSTPEVDHQSGRPFDFITLPTARRQEIWQLGTKRAAAHGPYVEWLILRHALALHGPELPASAPDQWSPLVATWRARSAEILDQTGRSSTELEADYAWLNYCDRLSLSAASRGGFDSARVKWCRDGDVDVLELKRFPLAGSTTLQLRFRELFAPTFEDSPAFAVALASARWQTAPVRLVATNH